MTYNPFVLPFLWLIGTAFIAVMTAIVSDSPGFRASAIAVIIGNAVVGLHLYALTVTP